MLHSGIYLLYINTPINRKLRIKGRLPGSLMKRGISRNSCLAQWTRTIRRRLLYHHPKHSLGAEYQKKYCNYSHKTKIYLLHTWLQNISLKLLETIITGDMNIKNTMLTQKYVTKHTFMYFHVSVLTTLRLKQNSKQAALE